MEKDINELKKEYSDLTLSSYTHFNFEVSDEDGFLCISQIRKDKRKQVILLQYSQIKNFVDCINHIKEDFNQSEVIKQKIETLEKEK